MKEIDYPIDYFLYSVEEIEVIINFLNTIEICYIYGVLNEDYKKIYTEFKKVVKAKSEENNLYKNFKKVSGYDGYLTTKKMKENVSLIKI